MKYQKIISLLNQNNLPEATKEVLNELEKNEKDSNLYNFLGMIDALVDNVKDAIKNFRLSIKLDDNNYDAYHNLAVNLSKIDLSNPEIIFFFEKSIECDDLNLNQNYILFITNYGFYLNKINSNKAEECFKKSIHVNDKNFRAYIGLSQFYFDNEKYEQCIKLCEGAIKNQIDHEGIYFYLASSYLKKNFFKESLNNFNQVLNFNKFNPEAHANLGLIYFLTEKYDLALNHLNLSISINPNSYEVLNNLGLVYLKKNDFVNSLKSFSKAYRLNKNNPWILNCIANHYKKMHKTKIANYYFKKALSFKEIDREILSNYVFQLTLDEKVDYEFYLNEAKKISFLIKSSNENFNKNGYKKNKIGFVSADLRNHPVGFFLKDTLKYLSETFDIYCYSNSLEEDSFSEEIKKNVYSWNNIRLVDTNNVKLEILENKIDILFDMGGHTRDNRLDIFAIRSAPIQISWSGWLASTGLKNMDYTIIDKNIYTNNLSKFFVEKFIIMDKIWNAYSINNLFLDNNKNSTPPCTVNGYLTFGAFHNLIKINESVIKAWSEILKGTNNKIYFISDELSNKLFLNKFIKKFTSKGVDKSQIIFHKKMEREIFFNEYKKIDILLDTFPYSGGSSSFETIGMDVPILTLEGDYFLSRCGYSINTNLNMQSLIAKSVEDYIKIAKNLRCSHIENYKKKLLSNNKNTLALFNSNKFSSELADKLKILMKNDN